MKALVVSALLVATPWGMVSPAPAQAPAERALAPTVAYRFENPAFLVSDIDLRLEASGDGVLRFTRKGLAAPVERRFTVRPETFRRIEELLDRAGFFGATEYQSPKDFSHLGTVTLAASRGGRDRTVKFNYTENREATQLVQLLSGLANREMRLFDLEVASRYAPLQTPSLLQGLEDELKLKRIAEPGALVPALKLIAQDVNLPLISRNRAEKLLKKLEAASAE